MNPIIPIERFEIFAQGVDHPECVAFDREGNAWCGGEAGQIYRIDPSGRVEKIADLGGFVGGVAFSPEDELFVCCPVHGVVKVARDGKWEVFASHVGERKLICPNFGVFDAAGNYFVTDSGQFRGFNGALIRYGKDGKGEVIAGSRDGKPSPPSAALATGLPSPGVSVDATRDRPGEEVAIGYANGLALREDESEIYMVESNTNSVYRYQLRDGKVVGGGKWIENVGRLPDGLALDELGNLYVSSYASDDIHRVTREGKVELFAWDPFAILLSRATNMAFVEDTMYVANLGRQTITRAKVGVRGMELVNRRK